MSACGCNGFNGNGNNNNGSFLNHIRDFVGENVIIFTESGGASGCGFEGILLSVHCDYVRIATSQGLSPSNPLSETICGDFDYDRNYVSGTSCNRNGNHEGRRQRLGSVCDIPINKIVALCHNAV